MKQKRTRLQWYVVFFPLFVFCFAYIDHTEAQFDEGLGVNTLNGEQYFCERSGKTPKKNKILITRSGKKLRRLSAKRARVRVRKARKSATKRKRTLKRRRKQVNRQLKRLANKPLESLINQQKIQELQERRDKFNSLIANIDVTRSNLSEVLKGISRCTKRQPLGGSLDVVSGTYENGGRENFYARLVYRVTGNPSASRVCALVSGHSEPINGGGGVYYLDPPFVSNMFIRFGSTCIAAVSNLSTGEDKCFASVSGPVVLLAGISGPQAPDTCNPKHTCSLSEAVALLTARAAQMGVTPLGLTNSGSCNQDLNSYR